MVTFAGVRSFIDQSSSNEIVKNLLGGFFSEVQAGRIKLFNPDGYKVKNFFKETADTVLQSMIWYYYDPRPFPPDMKILYQSFAADEDDEGSLEEVHTLIGIVLRLCYTYADTFHDGMEVEHLKVPVQGALIRCQDHEGDISLVFYQPPMTPHLAFKMLYTATDKRFAKRR